MQLGRAGPPVAEISKCAPPRYGAHTPLTVSRYGGCGPAMRSAPVGGGAKNRVGRLIIGGATG